MGERKSKGRPREFDKNIVLKKIMTVFWKKGYEGTSISDLLEVTRLNKGSLYAAFGDKKSMYRKALELYDQTIIEDSIKKMTEKLPAKKRLRNFLDTTISPNRPSCFLCCALTDQAFTDEETNKQIRKSLARKERAVVHLISELLEKSSKNKDVIKLSHHILAIYLGMRVMATSGLSQRKLQEIRKYAMEKIEEYAVPST